MKKALVGAIAALFACVVGADEALDAALVKGEQFLLANQAPEGWWSDSRCPR